MNVAALAVGAQFNLAFRGMDLAIALQFSEDFIKLRMEGGLAAFAQIRRQCLPAAMLFLTKRPICSRLINSSAGAWSTAQEQLKD